MGEENAAGAVSLYPSLFTTGRLAMIARTRWLALAFVAALGAAHAQEKLPLVKVVATGGTIANTPSGRLHAGEVAEAIPELKKVARLEVEELMRVGSSAITLAQWLTLARRINEIFAREPEVKGVVVTHGSNTVEET